MAEPTEKREYYILDTRTVVGNCAIWWGHDSKGYVCDIGEAGLYTFTEACSHRDTDVPVHRDDALACVSRHVRRDTLGQRVDMHAAKTEQRARVRARYLKLGIDIDATTTGGDQ